MPNIGAHDQAGVYLNVLKRWWWLPFLFGLLSGGITYVGTKALMKPVYGASATLTVQPLTVTQTVNVPTDANEVASWMTSSLTEGYIARRLTGPALKDPKALYRTVCAADITDRFVTCSTTSAYPDAAASVINTLAYDFKPFYQRQTKAIFNRIIEHVKAKLADLNRQQARIDQRMQTLRAEHQAGSPQYVALESQLNSVSSALNNLVVAEAQDETVAGQLSGFMKVLSGAPKRPNQVGPHAARNTLLGMIIGVGIAAALIVLLEYLDDTFRSSEEIATWTGLPILGAVRRYEGSPEEMGMVASRMPRTAIAEAYRVARANIQFTNVTGETKVLVVTSARDGEGKTTTANNLATTFALAGQRVLLVDADLRRPGLTKMMGMKGNYGLTSALIQPGVQVVEPTEIPGLSLTPSGPIPPNPAELLGSQRMHDWIEENAKHYDVIVFDTPPILSVADTRILAALADGIILVLDPNLTTRRMVRQARLAVENVGARVLGILLNRDTMRGEGYYYNYYYYERYAREEQAAR